MDPKVQIQKFAAKEEKAVKAWFGSNLVPLSAGIVIGIVAELIIHHL